MYPERQLSAHHGGYYHGGHWGQPPYRYWGPYRPPFYPVPYPYFYPRPFFPPFPFY